MEAHQQLRPLFTLRPNANDVVSLCFINQQAPNSSTDDRDIDDDGYDDDDSSSDDEDEHDNYKFHNQSRLFQPLANSIHNASLLDAATSVSFTKNTISLATCHTDGSAYLWNLATHGAQPLTENRGPGLSLYWFPFSNTEATAMKGAGTGYPGLLAYQTRDEAGTITLHDITRSSSNIVSTFTTNSRSFLKVTGLPSYNILATPTPHECFLSLRDLRVGCNKPIGIIHGGGCARLDSGAEEIRKEGMIMSMSLCELNGGVILGCGMESGKVVFHDLRCMGKSPLRQDGSQELQGTGQHASIDLNDVESETDLETNPNSIKVGTEPILALDLQHSHDLHSTNNHKSRTSQECLLSKDPYSVIAIAGLAGNAADLLSRPKSEQGTVAVLKASFPSHEAASDLQLQSQHASFRGRIRARVNTCQLEPSKDDDDKSDDDGEEHLEHINRNAKPGVNTCRFRPDGRVFAVGGWDRRVRIYSRTNAKLVRILKGIHLNSVTAVDWVRGDEDLIRAGVLAAGSQDGTISIWRAFPH